MGKTTVENGMIVPLWLNNEFLTDVLLQGKCNEISITNFQVEEAVPKGDNFLSTIYRIVVKYHENKNGSVINKSYLLVKTLPVGDLLLKLLTESKGFEKEVHIYEVTFPAMYRILKSANGKVSPITARCFPTDRTKTLVLEDLKQLGYNMANRHEGLDLDHCRLTVRALARLHAASLALYNMDPTSMDAYEEGFYVDREDRRQQMNLYLEFNMAVLASVIEKWPGYEHYSEKIRALSHTAIDEMVKSVAPKKNALNVLNHGDCWVNNMMFRYCPSTGKVEDVRFVDFQIARFSSPALDLQYFFCTSANDEIRFKERDTLLREYHEELTETMKILNLDPDQFTFEQLKEEFKEKESFGLINACTVLCIMLAEKGEANEEDIKSGVNNPMEKAYSCSRYRKVLQSLLLHYGSIGLL